MTVISSSQLTHQVYLDLDLGLDLEMSTVVLGKDHEKENLLPDQENDIWFRARRRTILHFSKDFFFKK